MKLILLVLIDIYVGCRPILITVNVEIRAVHIFALFVFLKCPRKYVQNENNLYYAI